MSVDDGRAQDASGTPLVLEAGEKESAESSAQGGEGSGADAPREPDEVPVSERKPSRRRRPRTPAAEQPSAEQPSGAQSPDAQSPGAQSPGALGAHGALVPDELPGERGPESAVERAEEGESAGAPPEGAPAAAEEALAEEPAGPGRALSESELLEGVSALVFASPDPLSLRRLVALLEGPEPARVRAALAELARRLDASGLPLELRELAGGWRILSAARAAGWVARLAGEQKVERISGAALETLAIVAYRQPVTKAEIEAIRGVQAGPILRSLIDRGLVRVAGRSEQPGHPLQYGTTREFLDRFGLARIEDLPRDGELTED